MKRRNGAATTGTPCTSSWVTAAALLSLRLGFRSIPALAGPTEPRFGGQSALVGFENRHPTRHLLMPISAKGDVRGRDRPRTARARLGQPGDGGPGWGDWGLAADWWGLAPCESGE